MLYFFVGDDLVSSFFLGLFRMVSGMSNYYQIRASYSDQTADGTLSVVNVRATNSEKGRNLCGELR